MRVYALYFRNKWILCIVSIQFVAGVLLGCVSAAFDDRKCPHVDFLSGLSLKCSPDKPQESRGGCQSSPCFLAFHLITVDIRTLLSSGLTVSVRSMKLYCVFIIRSVSASSGLFWPLSLRFHRLRSHNDPFDKATNAQGTTCAPNFYRRCVHDIRIPFVNQHPENI